MYPSPVLVTLSVVDLSPPPDDLRTIRCLECRGVLDWHQPNDNSPYRLLAACRRCEAWHLLKVDVGLERATLAKLPDLDQLLNVQRH